MPLHIILQCDCGGLAGTGLDDGVWAAVLGNVHRCTILRLRGNPFQMLYRLVLLSRTPLPLLVKLDLQPKQCGWSNMTPPQRAALPLYPLLHDAEYACIEFPIQLTPSLHALRLDGYGLCRFSGNFATLHTLVLGQTGLEFIPELSQFFNVIRGMPNLVDLTIEGQVVRFPGGDLDLRRFDLPNLRRLHVTPLVSNVINVLRFLTACHLDSLKLSFGYLCKRNPLASPDLELPWHLSTSTVILTDWHADPHYREHICKCLYSQHDHMRHLPDGHEDNDDSCTLA